MALQQRRRRNWMLGAAGVIAGGVRAANNYVALRNMGVNARNEILRYMRNRRFKEKDNRTDLDRPAKPEFQGTVSLGKDVLFSKSKRNVHLGNYGRPHNDSTKSITWRWQSCVPYAPLGDRVEQPNRSLDLSIVRRYTDETAEATVTGMYLPMYCFDLGTQPTQSRNVQTKTTGHAQSIPMYRLKKTAATALTALGPSMPNYDWVPVLGANNFQNSNAGAPYSPYWNQEIKDTDPQGFTNVKRCWSEIEFLLQCSKKMDCKVHIAVVKFDRFTGPRRQYTIGDTAIGLAGSGSALPTLQSYDETVAGNDRNGVDVFWESFWDKRISHPLSQYNQQNKTRRIKFIKHEVINIHPDPNELTTTYGNDGTTVNGYTSSTSGVVHTHLKKMFVSGGRWINCMSNSSGDTAYSRAPVPYYAQQPPVFLDSAVGIAGAESGFTHAYGFNVIDRTIQTINLIDDYSRQHEEGNPWLLIWMEDNMPLSNHKSIGDSTRPWGPAYDTMQATQCCTFDFKVRSKMLYCQPAHTLGSSISVVSAGQNAS